MIKRFFTIVLFALVALSVLAQDITLIFDNDVHCAVDGYAKVAALRRETPKEFTVMISAGDFMNGDVIGSTDKGEKIIDIMNAVKYDIVTLGNHEFDYGVEVLGERLGVLDAKILCMNFKKGDKNVVSSYTVREYGGRRVAYIGVTTPALIQSSTPIYFMNESKKFAYDFGGRKLIEMIQEKVNDIRREGVDYIVLISHIGMEADQFGISTPEVLKNTSGIDIVIDGHSHNAMIERLPNKNGEEVLVMQTGAMMQNIGRLTIAEDGTLKPELLKLADLWKVDQPTKDIIDNAKKELQKEMSRKIGSSRVTLQARDREGNLVIRSHETNFGDFVADAICRVTKSDCGFINAGSIRYDLDNGNFTLGQWNKCVPFNNEIWTAECTGAQLLDILEYSVALLPGDAGSFQQISGIELIVDSKIPSPVKYSIEGFVSAIEGKRRVVSAKVWNGETGRYEKIDANKTYKIATTDYALLKMGCNNMFKGCEVLGDRPFGTISEVVETYIKKKLNGTIGEEYRKSQNRIKIL